MVGYWAQESHRHHHTASIAANALCPFPGLKGVQTPVQGVCKLWYYSENTICYFTVPPWVAGILACLCAASSSDRQILAGLSSEVWKHVPCGTPKSRNTSCFWCLFCWGADCTHTWLSSLAAPLLSMPSGFTPAAAPVILSPTECLRSCWMPKREMGKSH